MIEMSTKIASLPSIRTAPELAEKVREACATLELPYSMVVENLLRQWLSGTVKLQMELDPDFVANAKAALESEESQKAMRKLAEGFKKNREYPEAIKI